MYTAKIINKIQNPTTRIWTVDVEFSNGADTFIEAVKPQDKQGFEYWVKDRLNSLNGLAELIAEDNLNKEVVIPTSPEPTADEIAKMEWFRDFGRLERVQRLIDLGVLMGTETPVTNLRTRVRTNFKAAYLTDM